MPCCRDITANERVRRSARCAVRRTAREPNDGVRVGQFQIPAVRGRQRIPRRFVNLTAKTPVPGHKELEHE